MFRVVEGRQVLGFTPKPLKPVGLSDKLRRENLDGHRALERRVPCVKDLAHAATAETLDDVVVPKGQAGLERCRQNAAHTSCKDTVPAELRVLGAFARSHAAAIAASTNKDRSAKVSTRKMSRSSAPRVRITR